jgi:probable O-glycosylation ligase (exosortase A-associated)
MKLYTVIPLLVFIISFLGNKMNSHGAIWRSSNTHALVFFLVWILLSVIVATKAEATYTRLNQAFGYFLFYYILGRVLVDIDRVKGVFLVVTSVHVALIYFNPDLLDSSARTYIKDVTFLGDGNDFALSLCVVLPFCLYLFLESNKKITRVLFLVAMGVLVLALVGTQSRGGTLGLSAVMFYLWWKSGQRVVGALAILVLVIGIVFVASPEYLSRMGTLSHYEDDGSAQGRIDAWTNAVKMALHNPLFGVGSGNFTVINGLTAHSIYFLALGELGVPGMLFIITYLLFNIRRNEKLLTSLESTDFDGRTRYRRMVVCLNASFIGYSVSGAFLSALYYPHIFVLGGIAVAVKYLSENEIADKKTSVLNDDNDERAREKIRLY